MKYKRCIVIVNPLSTQSVSVLEELGVLSQYFQKKHIITHTLSRADFARPNRLSERLTKLPKPSLVIVIGGDGTIHFVVNLILNSQKQGELTVLPLKGGNASDIAHMLHGKHVSELVTILNDSSERQVYALRITINGTSRFALAYVSFGALAYTMMRLDGLARNNRLLLRLRFLALLGEATGSMISLLKAHRFKVKINGKQSRYYYDITYVNGSRMAKVMRTPTKLTKPSYIRFDVRHKYPLLLQHLALLLKYHYGRNPRRNDTSYVFDEPVWMQIDGEVEQLPAHTKVSVAKDVEPYTVLSHAA